jgi:hypothetical protein
LDADGSEEKVIVKVSIRVRIWVCCSLMGSGGRQTGGLVRNQYGEGKRADMKTLVDV